MLELISDLDKIIKDKLGCSFDSGFFVKNLPSLENYDWKTARQTFIYNRLKILYKLYLYIDQTENEMLCNRFIEYLIKDCYLIRLNSTNYENYLLKQLSKYDFFGIENDLKTDFFSNTLYYNEYCYLCNSLPKSIFTMNRIYKFSKQFKYISFDIFDTLLFRPYENPTDLFEHLGILNNVKDFKKIRINAEIKAREVSKYSEINIDEIYENIPSDLMYLKEQEKMLEKSILTPNIRLVKLINKLKKIGKIIIITSDMYLDKNTIYDILNKNSIKYDCLFLSSEYRKTKHNGDLFEEIINKFGIDYSEILHIGDNEHADYKMSTKLGIHAIHINKYKDDVNIKSYTKCDNIIFNINLHMLKIYKYHFFMEYWEEIGYKYAGILSLFLSNEVQKNVIENNINNLMFIARDGFLIRKFYRLLHNQVPSYYIYLSRYISKFLDDTNFKAKYKNYLFSKKKAWGKIGIFDVIAINFSAQKALLNFFNNDDLYGIYWIGGKQKANLNIIPIFDEDPERNLNVVLVESLITANYPTVKDITETGKPIYSDFDDNEVDRCKIYSKIIKGAMYFAYDIKHYSFNDFFKNLTCDDIYDYLKDFTLKADSEDIKQFSNLKHTENIHNNNYVGLNKYIQDFRTFRYRKLRKTSFKNFLLYVFYKYKNKFVCR